MARRRLVLTEKEKSLIKGLVSHTGLNDQEVLSIFSHVSRSINNREIGYFRNSNNPKYSGVTPSSVEEVNEFLKRYSKFEIVAKKFGTLPKEDYFDKVHQGCAAMLSAVANFNSPNNDWKTETFCVNAVIAWTYLIHAFCMKEGVEFRHINEGGEPILIEGRPKLLELSACLNLADVPIEEPVKANLKYLIHIRNAVAHEGSAHIQRFLEPKFQACALNFNRTLCKWFGDGFDISENLSIAIMFGELDLQLNSEVPDKSDLPAIIQTANLAVEEHIDSDTFNDPRYSYRVHVIPRTINNRNKADQIAYYSAAGSEMEMAIREVERQKYLPSDIVKIANDAGYGTNMHKFVTFWKSLDPDQNSGRGYGVRISKQWYWYQSMLDAFMDHLSNR